MTQVLALCRALLDLAMVLTVLLSLVWAILTFGAAVVIDATHTVLPEFWGHVREICVLNAVPPVCFTLVKVFHFHLNTTLALCLELFWLVCMHYARMLRHTQNVVPASAD